MVWFKIWFSEFEPQFGLVNWIFEHPYYVALKIRAQADERALVYEQCICINYSLSLASNVLWPIKLGKEMTDIYALSVT
jgi:hypothetical protein